jgi:hypothetical protein
MLPRVRITHWLMCPKSIKFLNCYSKTETYLKSEFARTLLPLPGRVRLVERIWRVR